MYTTNGPKVPSSSRSSGHRLLLVPCTEAQHRCLRAHRGGMRRADCTWHSKDNSRDVFGVLVYACAPALDLRGNTLGNSWRRELQWICEKVLVTVGLEWSPHICCCSDKYSHFICVAAQAMLEYAASQDKSPAREIPGISVHNAIVHSCTKKS